MLKTYIAKKVEAKIRAAARRGAHALDLEAEDWFSQTNISLTTLDLRDCDLCVAGQLRASSYGPGASDSLNLITDKLCKAMGSFSEKLGFDAAEFVCEHYTDVHSPLRPRRFDRAYAILQDEWEIQIRQRRDAAKAAA